VAPTASASRRGSDAALLLSIKRPSLIVRAISLDSSRYQLPSSGAPLAQ
jgi:hypothetical protein